jgi:acyl carrier protein
MHSTDIQPEIYDFVLENFLFGKAEGLSNDDSLVGKGVIDSTGVLELVSFIQQRFGIQMEDHEVIPDNLDSITKLVSFIKRKQSPSE